MEGRITKTENHDIYTKLMMHFNGNLYDSSRSGHSVSSIGGSLNSSIKKFGSHALYFDSTSYKYLEIDTRDFDFGTGDFTIDLWWYRTSITARHNVIIEIGSANNNDSFLLRTKSDGSGLQLYVNAAYTFDTAYTFSTGQWYHIAVVRSSGFTTFYINGVQQITPVADSDDISPTSSITRIGTAVHTTTQYLEGYLDELRISKGIARWTADFSAEIAAIKPDTDYASATDQELDSPSGSYDQNDCFIPALNTTSPKFGMSAGGAAYIGTSATVGPGSTITGDGSGNNEVKLFPYASDWNSFAGSEYNGIQRIWFPKSADNDKLGGFVDFYYHRDAFIYAFDTGGADIVIAQNRSVYKGSTSPSNLVVRWDGKIGPAGSATPEVTEDLSIGGVYPDDTLYQPYKTYKDLIAKYPKHWWKLNDTDGITRDCGYSPIDGVNTLGTLRGGHEGTIDASYFPGDGSQITIPENTDWNFDSSTSWAISFWVYPEFGAPNSNVFFGAVSGNDSMQGGENYALYPLAHNCIRWGAINAEWTTGVQLQRRQWQHVVLYYDGDSTTKKAYAFLNGAEVGSATSPSVGNSTSGVFEIGADFNVNYFNGKMQHFQIYKGVYLTHADVESIYKYGVVVSDPSVIETYPELLTKEKIRIINENRWKGAVLTGLQQSILDEQTRLITAGDF